MAYWEYKTETQNSWEYSERMEELILSGNGADGWELVQIRDATYDLQARVIYTFKRKY
jgi:hypothetical protein